MKRCVVAGCVLVVVSSLASAAVVLSDNPTGTDPVITTGATYSWLTGTNIDSAFATGDSACSKLQDATLGNARGSGDQWGTHNDPGQTTAIELWDLQDVYSIEEVKILYGNYNGSGGIGRVTISTSTDGVNFTEWKTLTDFTQDLLPDTWNTWSWGMQYASVSVTDTPVNAQFVKIETCRVGSTVSYPQQILVETTIYGDVVSPQGLSVLSDNPTGGASAITTGASYSWLTGTNVDAVFAANDSTCVKLKDATSSDARGSGSLWGTHGDPSQTTAIELWDLQDIYSIREVSILYGNYSNTGGLGEVVVSTSTDGVTFTEWKTMSSFPRILLPDLWNTWSWGMKYGMVNVTNTSVNARYVRIETSRGGYSQQVLVETTIYGNTLSAQTSAPVITPRIPYISGPVEVTISCDTPDAAIYYETDGSAPTTSGTAYSNPVTVVIDGDATLNAIAMAPGSSKSSMVSYSYELPATYNNPKFILAGSAVVDGNLDEWTDAEWAPMAITYDRDPADIEEAWYAARWETNKVYLAVKVKDLAHSFGDAYNAAAPSDGIEIYLHTDNPDGENYPNATTAQQYIVGPMASDVTQPWMAIAGNGVAVPVTAEMAPLVAQIGSVAVHVDSASGWITYELEITPYTYLSILETADFSTSIVTQLDAGEVIGLDVCAVANNAGVYTGMTSENSMTSKWSSWRNFGLHELITVNGDANLDGAVDVGDLGILAANYGSASGATWSLGDFTGDGTVDVGDLGVLAANYGSGSTSGANWDADYAKVFGEAEADEDDNAGSVCSGLGLPLIAGLVLMGLMLVKLDE